LAQDREVVAHATGTGFHAAGELEGARRSVEFEEDAGAAAPEE